jgi:hypothetical protein
VKWLSAKALVIYLLSAHLLKEKHMKILYIAIGLFAFISAASAQTTPQTAEQVSEQANAIIAALQVQRNNASDQAASAQAAASRAQAEVAKLTKEVSELKAKPILPPHVGDTDSAK